MEQIGAERALVMLREVPGWGLEGSILRRQFAFQGFADAVAFVVRLGFEAEAADHHPDLLISYKRVTVTYTTHSAGGLTNKDFEGAKTATRIADAMNGSVGLSR